MIIPRTIKSRFGSGIDAIIRPGLGVMVEVDADKKDRESIGQVAEPSTVDHGSLAGLGDDDHTQYVLADGSRAMTALTVTNAAVLGSNSVVFQPNADSTTFLQALQADGTVGLNYDSTNNRFGVLTATPSQALDLIGSMELEDTTTSTTGVVYKGANRFAHNFHHPTGDTAVPVGGNTFFGELAGNFTTGSTATLTSHGSYNNAVGSYSLYANTTGYQNNAMGYASLYSNTTGYQNSAMGYTSLRSNTEGNYNSAVGSYSLYANTEGDHNNAMGYSSLRFNTEGNYNSAVGSYSGYNVTTGSDNLFLGYKSGYNQTTNSNLLIIDNQDRGSAAAEITDCLIYGSFNVTPASQTLRFNVGSLTLGNPTHSDADGGGAVQLIGQREDSDGNSYASGQIECSHDGTAKDQLGKITESVNTGAGLVAARKIDSNGTMHTNFGRICNTTRATTTYQILVTDHIVFCNTDAAAWTATLPAGVEGQTLKIINSGSSGNDLTLAPTGAEHLIGANSNFTLSDGETLILTYNATDGWY